MTQIKGTVEAEWLNNGASLHGERCIGLTVVREVVIGGEKRYGCVSIEAFDGESPMNAEALDEEEPQLMSGDATILLDSQEARLLAAKLIAFAAAAGIVEGTELQKSAERKAKRRAARASARADGSKPSRKRAVGAQKTKAKPRKS